MKRSEKFLQTYKALGRQNLANRLPAPLRTIDAAVNVKRFPAAWFAVIAEMCAELQIECPIEIFSFYQAECVAKRGLIAADFSKGEQVAA